MRDKEKQMWCISCDKRVMTEDDLNAELDRTAQMTGGGGGGTGGGGAMAESESDRAARLRRIQAAASAAPPSALAMAASTVAKPSLSKPQAKAKRPVQRERTVREMMDMCEPTEEERQLGEYSLATVEHEPVSLEQMLGAAGAKSEPTPSPAPAPAPEPSPVRNGHVESSAVAEPEEEQAAAEPAVGISGAVISSSEISAQLSDLLLKGWRMLEEECPVTAACPLMQQKSTGRKFSVAIQKFTDELEAEPEPEPEPEPVLTPAPAPVPVFKVAVAEPRQLQQQRAASPPSVSYAGAATAAAGAGRVDVTIATIAQKIAAATARLDQVGEVDTAKRILLVTLIGACASAMRAVETLR